MLLKNFKKKIMLSYTFFFSYYKAFLFFFEVKILSLIKFIEKHNNIFNIKNHMIKM